MYNVNEEASTRQVPDKFRANNHVNPNELCFV